MLNKLLRTLRQYSMVQPGDSVVCAVSGGADSIALLFAMYLLKDKLQIELSAAHFNHHLRGAESDRDEAFVRKFCDRYDIPLAVGGGQVQSGPKGLEAAARDARYAFLRSLPGRIATAHTADDNAETVLMHLIRGTGLKGLGAIAPINGGVIRPMLAVTRQEVEAFLEEYCLPHIEDSSNAGDAFLRNRIRHEVLPLMKRENPAFAENVSAMALRLRQDEQWITGCLSPEMPGVEALRGMEPALRSRYLERFLRQSGVREPEQSHIGAAEALVFSQKPSAAARFPDGVVISRCYGELTARQEQPQLQQLQLCVPGVTELPEWNLRITCAEAAEPEWKRERFSVVLQGTPVVRARRSGDAIRLSGGTKTLKKLMIDRKIPAAQRDRIPVLADDGGVIAVAGIGANYDRKAENLPAVTICLEYIIP